MFDPWAGALASSMLACCTGLHIYCQAEQLEGDDEALPRACRLQTVTSGLLAGWLARSPRGSIGVCLNTPRAHVWQDIAEAAEETFAGAIVLKFRVYIGFT